MMDPTSVEDIDIDENVVLVRKPRRAGKRLHRAKRVIINDSQNSYLSRSYMLATNYKKKNAALLENNRKLAKALAESELKCQMMEKQMAETYRDLNYNNVLKMKMNKVTRNLSDMAAILRETVSIMESTLSYADDADETTNVIQSPKQTLEKGDNSAGGSGFDLIFPRNNSQFQSQIKPPDMSAIEEVSLSLAEHTAKIPFLFENEDEKEPKAASKTSDERIRKCSSGGNVKRSSARRQSSLIRARSKTPSPLKSDGSPFSETPKTPPVQFASSKFKSNIPKPCFKETKKTETYSPAKAIMPSDKEKDIQVANSSNKPSNLNQVITSKEVSSPAKKTLPDSKFKQQSLNSKAKKGNLDTKVKSTAANKKSFGKGAKNIQLEKHTTATDFSEAIIPTEHDDTNLNLRRCTFTVARSSISVASEGEKIDPFISQESLPAPNINRLTIVKSSNKDPFLSRESLPAPNVNRLTIVKSSSKEKCGEYSLPKITSGVISPSADKGIDIPPPRSEHTESDVKEKQDQSDVSSTVGQSEENKNPAPNLPNVTIIASVDMSLTEIIPKEIICAAIEQSSVAEPQTLQEVSVPALEQSAIAEAQSRSECANDCKNLDEELANKDEQSCKAPSQNKSNEAVEINIPSTASCRKSGMPQEKKLRKDIVSNKVSLVRRNSKNKKRSGNPATAKKKISCVFSSSDSDEDDVESNKSKLVSLFAVSPAKSLRLAPKQNHFVTLGNSPKVNVQKSISSSNLTSTDKEEGNKPPCKASSKSKSVQQSKTDNIIIQDDDDDEGEEDNEDFNLNFRSNHKKIRVIDSRGSKDDFIEPSHKQAPLDGPVTEVEHDTNNPKEEHNIKNIEAEAMSSVETSKKRSRKRKTDSNKTEKPTAKPRKTHKGKATRPMEEKDINDENCPLPPNKEMKKSRKKKSIACKINNVDSENKVKDPETKSDKNLEEKTLVTAEPVKNQGSSPAVQLNVKSPLQDKARESNVIVEDLEKHSTGSKLSSMWNLRLSSESVRSSNAPSDFGGKENSRRRKPVSYKEPSLSKKLRREK